MKALARNENSAIIWLCMAHLVSDVYSGFLNPIMPFIASKLGFTMALATVLIAIAQICSNMLQPIFGFFADNNLKRFFIFWGLILSAIFIPLSPCATSVVMLTLFMIFGCLGGSFFHPQSMGFINIFSGKNCSNNMGIFVSMGSLGFALGPLLAAFITQTVGLEKVVYTSIPGVILAIAMFFCVPKLSATYKKPEYKSFLNSFKKIFTNIQMIYLMLISMMKSLVTTSSCILLPFLWQKMGYSPFYIGFALFLFVFAGSIGSFLSPKAEKMFGSKPIIYFSMWGTLPILVCFALTYKTMPVISLCIFATMGFVTMLAQPVTLVLAQKTLPEYKSLVSGFINGFCWGVIAICISGLGLVAQNYGIIRVLLVLTVFPVLTTYFVKYLKEDLD